MARTADTNDVLIGIIKVGAIVIIGYIILRELIKLI